MLRAFLLFPLFLILAGIPSSTSDSRQVLGREGRMSAFPVPLDPTDPGRNRVGALTYLGGVRLTSPDHAFGGFSAMHVEGEEFVLLSDGGNIVRFRMGSDWRPTDIRFADLPGSGSGWYKWERDVESLTWDPKTGKFWVGFEIRNDIARYDTTLSRREAYRWSAAARKSDPIRQWDMNGGPESLARLRDGTFITISESTYPEGDRSQRLALLFAGDPAKRRTPFFSFRYVPPSGFSPSDMAELPDGRLLVLNRRFRFGEWFSAKLTIVDRKAISRGAIVRGREIATLAHPLTRDNFEAVAATQEGDATIVWLATDDNRAYFERSLLMKFRLELE